MSVSYIAAVFNAVTWFIRGPPYAEEPNHRTMRVCSLVHLKNVGQLPIETCSHVSLFKLSTMNIEIYLMASQCLHLDVH